MPTYGYRCDKCGYVFEKVQRFSDEPVKSCPICKTRGKVKRTVHATSIVFKGAGFYKTDSRKTSDKASETKPAEPKPKVETPKAPAAAE
jgi:putative FmdB family regulatory protein